MYIFKYEKQNKNVHYITINAMFLSAIIIYFLLSMKPIVAKVLIVMDCTNKCGISPRDLSVGYLLAVLCLLLQLFLYKNSGVLADS